MAPSVGIEPTTSDLEDPFSIQLKYEGFYSFSIVPRSCIGIQAQRTWSFVLDIPALHSTVPVFCTHWLRGIP